MDHEEPAALVAVRMRVLLRLGPAGRPTRVPHPRNTVRVLVNALSQRLDAVFLILNI